MADLRSKQRRWTLICRIFFATAISAALCTFALDYYYHYASPPSANEASGRTYPFFDKYDSRYVYVTRTEHDSIPFFICLGAISLVGAMLVDRKLRYIADDLSHSNEKASTQDSSHST